MATPTPPSRDILKDTPALRPSSRHLQKAILGENTPPSATMLALQTMTVPKELLDPTPPPLSNVTNSSATRAPQAPQPAPPLDSISNQLLSITNIVSSLQKDMTQLSRRSKDNASDLISLKEATSARDEDIRKSLKELVSTMHQVPHVGTPGDTSRSASSIGMRDPLATPTKQFTIPRLQSPSFMMDERAMSPNPYSVEGAASVAMLEKIIREMVTKDGQERLIANLQTLVDKATGETAKKVTELAEFVKQGSQAHALVPSPNSNPATLQPSPGTGPLMRSADATSSFPLQKVSDGNKPFSSPKAADFVSDEMLKFLRKIKDSVAESGCVTMANKAMIQDLRGEVLGMGRELARKLEEVEKANAGSRSIESGQPPQDIARIIQEGLANVKQHMDQVMREKRRQSISSTMTRNTVDSQEVYDVVKHALAERGLDKVPPHAATVDKEAIISAIREAYESYKPHIEIEQIGLERDEVLQCLREGLQEYRGSGSITRDDIEHIIQDSFQTIKLPPPINEAHELREEILMAVRECLEEFKPALVPAQARNEEVSRQMILDAIREGLGQQEIEIPQEALFDAVKVGLESTQAQHQRQDNDIMQHLHAMVDDMHHEFKNYSSASGRDTEQVLDALKDGLDTLRSQIETYVDKTQDITNKDEIVDNLRLELERLRADIQGYVAEGPRGDQAWPRGEMVTYIKSEFENLLESLSTQFSPSVQHKEEILHALNAGFEGMKSQVAVRDLGEDTNDEMNEALKVEFEQLKDVILGDTVHNKDEIVRTLHEGFESLHAKLGDGPGETSNNEILVSLKEEFEHLRETLGGTLVRAGGAADKEDIIDAVRELIDGLRSEFATTHQDAAKSGMGAIQTELEQLRESLGSMLVRTEGSSEKGELLDAIRVGLEDIKSSSQSLGFNKELLEALRGELEQVRASDTVTRQHARADAEEILETVRLGLDDLRSHLEKRLDNPESQMFATNEILDALNDGLEGLHNDVMKSVDKPVDMTVSYEILDTLKDGIAGLREDIASLKEKSATTPEDVPAQNTGLQVVLAEGPDGPAGRDIVGEALRREHLEKMELMLAQVQDKVEAMDANIQHPPNVTESAAVPNATTAQDFSGIEALLKDLQSSVLQLQEREFTMTVDGMATKEDTDAIETLLDNVKAKIEELNLPNAESTITKENLDDIELVVRTTSESLEALSLKITEEGATKGDVAVVQVIVDDIKQALDEMKTAKPTEEEEALKVTKTDVDDLAAIVCDIKAKVDEMKIPDGDELPSKADVEQLTGLILEFRESHDKLHTTYEEDIFKTAKNFDERRLEAEALAESITEVKVVLDEVKDEIKATLVEGGGLESVKESFKALEDSVGTHFGISADVKELMETVSREFERAHGSIEGLLNGQEEKSALALEKQEEAKDNIIASVVDKIEDRFNTLMTKYDDAQLLADEQAKVMKEKAEEQEKILESTKAMADELKLSIDTLGASITGMNDKYEEATQKWATDYSAAVFGKIDDAVSKLEEQRIEDKTEHSHTRDEIANVERIFTGLQDNITEYHPKFMVTLREIEALVKQHYEDSKKTKESAEEQVRLINEEARTRAEELSKHLNSLPALLPPPPPAIEAVEKYDDAQVQEKLDKLIGHVSEAEKSAAHLERLDEIHKQVKATAAEVTEFVNKQTQLITDGNEAKEREAEELARLVERRSVQKEQLESEVERLMAEKETVLRELKEEKERAMAELKAEKERTVLEVKEEKESLLAAVAALQAERENLANQKVRLTGEVSSLHTALEIRREELHMMDAKADALERRILNGIMDHSRALMIAKSGSTSPTKLRKRMSTDVSNGDSKLMPPPSTAANGLSLALKPRPALRRGAPTSNPANRRILSLSQISGNTPTGAQAYPTTTTTMSNNANLKRSHSVKTNYMRKTSWNGRPVATVANKENEALKEEDESEGRSTPVALPADEVHSPTEEDAHRDDQSETGTERRHSFASGSYDEGSYADGEHEIDGHSSYGGGSEYTYASGSSYMSGSDVDRRTSYGSTAARSTLMGGDNTIEEGSEDERSGESAVEDDDEPTAKIPITPGAESTVTASDVTGSEVTGSELSTALMPTHSEIDRAVEAVKEEMKKDFIAPSDSGIGTDLPTALIGSESEADYFRRQAEEESTVG